MLSRHSLSQAIQFGLRKSEGKPLAERTAAILDAIDMVIELQATATSAMTPTVESPDLDTEPSQLPPPPNPESIAPAPRIVDVEPRPEPLPPPKPVPSMLVVADDSMASREIEQHREKNGLRLRSLSLRKGQPRISLEGVMKWAAATFPMQIRLTPLGVDHEISLDRRLGAIPFSGEGRSIERESTIKVAYFHPSLDSTMEVGVPIRVGDVQEQWPDANNILELIKTQARQLYRRRPSRIEGAAPAGPTLEQAHRFAMSEISKRAKGQAASPEISITLADAGRIPGEPV